MDLVHLACEDEKLGASYRIKTAGFCMSFVSVFDLEECHIAYKFILTNATLFDIIEELKFL